MDTTAPTTAQNSAPTTPAAAPTPAPSAPTNAPTDAPTAKPVAITNPQQKFDEALSLLSQKKTLEGTEALRELRNSGATSAGVESNLGRALVDLGDLGQGIPLLMNAVALDRVSSIHRKNLHFAQSKVENGWGLPMSHPAEWAARISSVIRPQEMLTLSSLVLLAVVWLAVLKKLRKLTGAAILAGCIALLALGGFGLSSRSLAVVTKKEVLRSAPLVSADELMSLGAGVRLRILRESGDFAEVERPGNFRGWISKTSVSRNPY